MNQWGLAGKVFGTAYGAVFLTLMALTIMYLVVRFMRVASAEALGEVMPVIRNQHVGTIIALALTLVLIWLVPFLQIWTVFGAANQLMASLALLLVTLWLMSKGKSYQWTLWPFLFMFVTTIAALLWKAYEAFFINLPKVEALATKAKLTVGQVTVANVLIGGISWCWWCEPLSWPGMLIRLSANTVPRKLAPLAAAKARKFLPIMRPIRTHRRFLPAARRVGPVPHL